MTQDEQSTWTQETLSALRQAGFRGGSARRAVVELLSRQDCCLTAQQIYEGVRASGRHIGMASVYRVLDVLSELGLLNRVDLGGGSARYEPARPGGDHHHHVVCDDCGKVEPFTDRSLERAIAGVSSRLGYAVAAHDVVLRGECDDCRVTG